MVARLIGVTLAIGMLTACGYSVYAAVYRYRAAAERGNADAQNNLGSMYANGRVVQQDYAEAVRWYRLAAEQGLAEGQCNLGVMYEKGHGVKQDHAEAVRWFRLAAEQGHANAQNKLGIMYHIGMGVQQDYAEAALWYRLAAEQGDADARDALDWLTRNTIQAQAPPVNQFPERPRITERRSPVILPDTTFVVALLALDCPELDNGQTNLLTEIVRTELFRTGVFDLMERDKMTSMLDEVGFAYSACTSTQCVIEAGRILSVQHMVAGSVGRIGNTYVINLRAFDVTTGRTVSTASKYCRDCAIDDMVETAIPEAVEELAVTITGTGS